MLVETPPLTRRKHYGAEVPDGALGNTSAYAEKTLDFNFFFPGVQKHLRLRGENARLTPPVTDPIETPPLTRRKPDNVFINREKDRNTSAYAEKTLLWQS